MGKWDISNANKIQEKTYIIHLDGCHVLHITHISYEKRFIHSFKFSVVLFISSEITGSVIFLRKGVALTARKMLSHFIHGQSRYILYTNGILK